MTIYETITNRILNQLEAGVVPWQKNWTSGLPKSLTTAKEYRGINLLVLGCAAYTSRYWITYRQAERLGGHVRKGERATPVVYWNWRTPEELERLKAKTGKQGLAPCVPFTSAVFNLEQVEGIERPEDDVPANRERRLEIADGILDVMPDKPEITHAVNAQPAYCPATDRITLPHLSQFANADAYYSVLYHELTHASGAPHRLNRFQDAQRDEPEKYSLEELVAEFGAAFLCGFAGLQNTAREAQQASYIEGWSRVLKKDHRLIVRAASAAQRAADYIRGKTVATDELAVAA
jgi:antirestriction protein ArdC